MDYAPGEAKEWARQHMKGVCNVILPTFTQDLKRLNEKAIRHDVRRNIELGFWGALVVSECGTTKEEYKKFLEIVIDEARGRMRVVVHGSFDTVEDVVEVCRFAEAAGADALLLAYPPTFYPRTAQDIYEYTRAVLEGTRLATILFAVHQWNFDRIHPAQLPVELVEELARFPNVVAIKAEGSGPALGSVVELLDRCGTQILISDPREFHSPVWVRLFGMQWMGTSNYEYFGDRVPRYFRLMHEGRWKEAMELYWQIHPARMARLQDMQSYAGANFIHRFSWKYQAWLNGYNGGPLRLPVMRLTDAQVRRLRDALVRSGVIPPDTPGDLGEFFVGRHPE